MRRKHTLEPAVPSADRDFRARLSLAQAVFCVYRGYESSEYSLRNFRPILDDDTDNRRAEPLPDEAVQADIAMRSAALAVILEAIEVRRDVEAARWVLRATGPDRLCCRSLIGRHAIPVYAAACRLVHHEMIAHPGGP